MRSKVFSIFISAILLTAIASSLSWAADWVTNIGNNVYGIYSETYPGMEFDVPNSTSSRYIHRDGGYMGVWPSTATVLMDDTTTYLEGRQALRITVSSGSTGGLWTQFGYSSSVVTQPLVSTYMGDYNAGTLEFSIKTAYEVAIELKWQRGTIQQKYTRYLNQNFKVPLDNQWHNVSVKLSTFTGIQVSSITVPVSFNIVTPAAEDVTFWVDNVRWYKSNSLTQGSLAIARLRELADDTTTYVFSWSDIQGGGGTGWKCANQYIEYKLGYSTPTWGVQIFTDNTAADADPKYTGIISTATSAAGLVCSTDTAATPLPMCWRISDYKLDASTLTIAASGDHNHLYCPALGGDNGYYPWMFIKDKADANFVYSEDYVTMWDLRGIHYGEGEWGPAMSPNYIYIGADFSRVMAGRSYITNKLIIDLFYE